MLSALAYVSALPLQAGEIAGLPANTPPALDSPVAFGFYNDFLGRGGRSDDYRTQQLILTGRFAERWYATLDHSILMFQEPSDPGRVDQLSATLGYALIDSRDDDSWQRVLLGTGVRTHGDLAGERMQNGFHQLFDIDLEFLPYREGEDDSAVAWVDGQHQWVQASDARFRPGYWLRGSALVTSDGQLDAAIGAYATLSHRSIELWAGLRQDWREGYDSAVMRAAASVESDTAAVLGLAWGPLVIETVQQFNGEGSYGSLRFVSVPQSRDAIDARRARYAVSLAFLLPDIRVGAEGRSAPRWLNRDDAIWTTSLAARIDTGQPQVDGDNTLYIDTTELAAGLDFAREIVPGDDRFVAYASIGMGARSEQLFGAGERQGTASSTVTGTVGQLGAGLRVRLADLGADWRLRLKLGADASLPFSDRSVAFGAEQRTLLEPRLALRIGIVVENR